MFVDKCKNPDYDHFLCVPKCCKMPVTDVVLLFPHFPTFSTLSNTEITIYIVYNNCFLQMLSIWSCPKHFHVVKAFQVNPLPHNAAV